jgi:hypothetical protein
LFAARKEVKLLKLLASSKKALATARRLGAFHPQPQPPSPTAAAGAETWEGQGKPKKQRGGLLSSFLLSQPGHLLSSRGRLPTIWATRCSPSSNPNREYNTVCCMGGGSRSRHSSHSGACCVGEPLPNETLGSLSSGMLMDKPCDPISHDRGTSRHRVPQERYCLLRRAGKPQPIPGALRARSEHGI